MSRMSVKYRYSILYQLQDSLDDLPRARVASLLHGLEGRDPLSGARRWGGESTELRVRKHLPVLTLTLTCPVTAGKSRPSPTHPPKNSVDTSLFISNILGSLKEERASSCGWLEEFTAWQI